jgi:hypothetical protein
MLAYDVDEIDGRYVNFINTLRTNFLYEHCFGSLESGFEQTYEQKIHAKNIDEIDDRYVN